MYLSFFISILLSILDFWVCKADATQGVSKSVSSPSKIISRQQIPNARHEGRTLRAARLKSELRARSITETLRHNHELHYLDG